MLASGQNKGRQDKILAGLRAGGAFRTFQPTLRQAAQTLVAYACFDEEILPDWIRAGVDKEYPSLFGTARTVHEQLGALLGKLETNPAFRPMLADLVRNKVLILDKGITGTTDAWVTAMEVWDTVRPPRGGAPSREAFSLLLRERLGAIPDETEPQAQLEELIAAAIADFDVRRLDPDGDEPYSAAQDLAAKIAQALKQNDRRRRQEKVKADASRKGRTS